MTSAQSIERILAQCQTWAIVGLGGNPHRPAFEVASFLQAHGKRIIPVYRWPGEVLGEQIVTDLSSLVGQVDCVDVFRRSDQAGAFADIAIDIGARAVWFQLGVIDLAATERVRAAGMDMVYDRCPAIEWAEHGPS
jgi:predicted CoA-binding protein